MTERLKSTALLFGSFVVGVLLLELAVRLFLPQQLILLRPDIWQPDSITGHRHAADIRTRVNWGEGAVDLFTDENGYRIDRPEDANAAKADISILAIGDSFLEALQVESERTVPQVIRALLEDRYNRFVKVDNASSAGWNPNHYYKVAGQALSQTTYDLGIVFLFVGNDVVSEEVEFIKPRAPTIRHTLRMPRGITRGELVDAILYPVNDFLERTSQLYIFVKKSSSTLLTRLGLTALYIPAVVKIAEADSPDWDVTTSICKKISEVFYAHDTPLFFVLLPINFQVNEDIFEDYVRYFDIDPQNISLDQPNEELSGRFAAEGLQLVDTIDCLREKRRGGHTLYGSVDTHLTEDGHRTIAECLLPTIESSLSLGTGN
ncbi:MAG: hypothetical protein JSW58_09595 [Candidatus Latescibacterota bacterium]|nr:MAG: hypothetical protein JSW58_09595 [Candidatus Latescibacterota bacterium]